MNGSVTIDALRCSILLVNVPPFARNVEVNEIAVRWLLNHSILAMPLHMGSGFRKAKSAVEEDGLSSIEICKVQMKWEELPSFKNRGTECRR